MISLPWLIAVAFVIGIVQDAIYRRYGLARTMHARQFSEQAVYVGDTVDLVERIENHKWLPLPWLQVESMFPIGLHFASSQGTAMVTGQSFSYHQSLFSLPPYTKITRRHHITCTLRGIYGLQQTTLTCGNLFGMSAKFQKFVPSSELIVYPAILSLDDIPFPSHSWLGDITVRRFILPDPFTQAGTRAYESGDALRQINWKATARTAQLQVQKQDFTADLKLHVYLNFEVSEEMWEAVTDHDAVELGISYAATLAQYSILQGLEIGFACNGVVSNDDRKNRFTRVSPDAGASHLHHLLTIMAGLTMRCSGSFYTLLEEDVLQGTTRRDYLLISKYQSERLLQCADQLRELGNTVEWLQL